LKSCWQIRGSEDVGRAYIWMEDKLAARIKVTVSEEMEGKMIEMVDAELQNLNVEKNLNKCREEKGGYGS
jgi:hypothetical protein